MLVKGDIFAFAKAPSPFPAIFSVGIVVTGRSLARTSFSSASFTHDSFSIPNLGQNALSILVLLF